LRRRPASIEKRLAQALKLLVLRMQFAQVSIRRFHVRNLGDDELRVFERQLHVENAAERSGINPPALGIARILEDLESELGLSFRKCVRLRLILKCRQIEL